MSDGKKTSRRKFITGTAVAGAGVLALAGSQVLAQTPTPAADLTATPEATGTPLGEETPAAEETPTAEGTPAAPPTGKPGQAYDVIVAGSGVGGLAAALAAAQEGVSVLLIEASQETGGTAMFSGGAIHVFGAQSFEELQERAPLIDPELGQAFYEAYGPMLEWLQETNIEWPEMSPALAVALGENALSIGDSYEQKRQTVDQWVQAIVDAGAEVVTGTRALSLMQENGRVTGLVVANGEGEHMEITANMGVVLATGAFPNNKEMMVRYFSPHADLAVCRAVPYNRGDALLMAEEVGARLSRSFGTYYGHLQAWPPIVPQDEESYEAFDKQLLRDLMGAVQGYEPTSVLVNMNGVRFVDESLGDDIANQELIMQPLARGFMFLDSAMAVSTANLELIEANGGVVLTADTLEDLTQMVAEFGVSAGALLNTLNEYNQAVEGGTTGDLVPARSGNIQGLVEPPFYAVPVTPGVSANYGGLMINRDAQVLGRDMQPIPGLYAAPHAAGGIFYRDYGGSLGLCTTFGRIAGTSAATGKAGTVQAKAAVARS
ncbi:MAG: FAD-dependent oxidoreductase [Anaerolineae bacterium]|jgi:succinate dehydrogenase/fumarate reductase flavoprotein subunit